MAASVRCDETGNGLDREEGDKVVQELVAEYRVLEKLERIEKQIRNTFC